MVRIGLIGCGAAGENHMTAMQQVDAVTLAAVADVRESAAPKPGGNTGRLTTRMRPT